ncbi:MAG TPA: hypothetical protein VED63_04285 [Acidimicrobiales bacterium]|nr:hypothetical protein [Acidimicrobiales bacterium]
MCEYAIAVALVVTSVHVAGGGLLVAGGIAFGLLAATGRGPTGVAPVCPPRLHAALDVVVALCLALAPILPALRPDLTGILTVEFAAVGWLRVTTLTSFTRRTPVTTPDGQAVPPPGRTAGDTDATAPAPRSSSRSAILGGARHLGRGAGRARRAWKRSTGPVD